jgi:hypothetical protein
MKKLLTFLAMVWAVLDRQRQHWINPGKDLADNIELKLFGDQPTATAASGLAEPPNSSYPWTRDRNVPPHLLKSRRGFN